MANCDSAAQATEVADMTFYAVDIASSVSSFLKILPQTAKIFHSTQFFETKLSGFYQQVITGLWKYMDRQARSGFLKPDQTSRFFAQLKFARNACVEAFRIIIRECSLNINKIDAHSAEIFLHALTNALSEGDLLLDYSKKYPLKEDLALFQQAGVHLDRTRIDFITNGIHKIQMDRDAGLAKAESSRVFDDAEISARMKDGSIGGASSASVPQSYPSGIELDSLISQVKDLFPELGEGFIDESLAYFEFDPEKLINALLEENLPPHLVEKDRTSKVRLNREEKLKFDVQERIPSVEDEIPAEVLKEIDEQEQLFIPSGKKIAGVHRGKRTEVSSANALLDDKSFIQGLKSQYAPLGIVVDEVVIDAANDLGYDDEYDDTYDDAGVGQAEPDAADEGEGGRKFVLPRALGGGHIRSDKAKESDSGSEEDENDRRKRDDFTRNPAEIREENERKRQLKQQETRRRKGRQQSNPQNSGGAGPNTPPHRDVVGRAKGQGQEKQVLINRSRKNANKGKSVRAAADKKMSRGMF